MRWSVPEVGDSRWRRIFLLTPRQIGRQRVWLEWIWVQEVYRNGYITFNESEWEEVDWRFERPGFDANSCLGGDSELNG